MLRGVLPLGSFRGSHPPKRKSIFCEDLLDFVCA